MVYASLGAGLRQDREARVREVAYAIFKDTGCTDEVANWCVVKTGGGGRRGQATGCQPAVCGSRFFLLLLGWCPTPRMAAVALVDADAGSPPCGSPAHAATAVALVDADAGCPPRGSPAHAATAGADSMPGSWACPTCTFKNYHCAGPGSPHTCLCVVCGAARPGGPSAQVVGVATHMRCPVPGCPRFVRTVGVVQHVQATHPGCWCVICALVRARESPVGLPTGLRPESAA
jgi:hypothetical protein